MQLNNKQAAATRDAAGGKVLLVEDDLAMAGVIAEKLESAGHTVACERAGENALARINKECFDVVILDYLLPGMDGLSALERIGAAAASPSVIFITAHGDHEIAWKSLQLGASEYLDKPFNLNTLGFFVYKLVRQREINRKACALESGETHGEFIRRDEKMEKIWQRLPLYAAAELPTLVSGETGTGKDLITMQIARHAKNPRRNKPFFAVNCMAIPENLVESELFGHLKGAFTGALLDKKGFFEVADGGTIFLDEISGASQAVQGKLLRIIESGEFYRVGDTKPARTNVRIIAATNKDLLDEVQEGRFRQDLYYRLNGLRVELPPLRERRADIAPLAQHFIAEAAKKRGLKISLSDEALSALEAHDWPGNVRELKNATLSAASISGGGLIEAEDLPARRPSRDSGAGFSEQRDNAIARFETDYFKALLKKTGGNVAAAARESGIARQHLFTKLKNLGIDPDKFR